jgi:hypothetical protein
MPGGKAKRSFENQRTNLALRSAGDMQAAGSTWCR